MQEIENKKEEKKIKVVTGDGKINISPVSTHLEVERPHRKNDKDIIIPDVKKEIPESKDSKDNN